MITAGCRDAAGTMTCEDMESTAIYEKLTRVFHDVFDDDAIVLRPDLTAEDVDEWDSLSHIRLVLTVERTFNVKFSASEIAKLKNVGEFVDLIQSKAA
jgi:acyl carrier protein